MSRGRCLLLPRRQARLGGVVLRAQGTCRASAVGGPGDESRVQPGICDAHLALKSSRAAGAMVYPLLKGVGVGREPEAGSTCGGPGALGFRGFCWGKLRRLGTQHLAGPSWGTCRWVYKVGAAIGAAHFIRGLCWGEPRRPGAQNPPGPTWKGLPLSAKGALVLARLVPHLLQLGSWRWLQVQHLTPPKLAVRAARNLMRRSPQAPGVQSILAWKVCGRGSANASHICVVCDAVAARGESPVPKGQYSEGWVT